MRCAVDGYHYRPLVDLASLYECWEFKITETARREKVHAVEESQMFSQAAKAKITGSGERGRSELRWLPDVVK